MSASYRGQTAHVFLVEFSSGRSLLPRLLLLPLPLLIHPSHGHGVHLTSSLVL